MKITHTIKLNRQQLADLLIDHLGLPGGAKAVFNLVTAGSLRDEYTEFGNVELSYETELANVTNKQGPPASR